MPSSLTLHPNLSKRLLPAGCVTGFTVSKLHFSVPNAKSYYHNEVVFVRNSNPMFENTLDFTQKTQKVDRKYYSNCNMELSKHSSIHICMYVRSLPSFGKVGPIRYDSSRKHFFLP